MIDDTYSWVFVCHFVVAKLIGCWISGGIVAYVVWLHRAAQIVAGASLGERFTKVLCTDKCSHYSASIYTHPSVLVTDRALYDTSSCVSV